MMAAMKPYVVLIKGSRHRTQGLTKSNIRKHIVQGSISIFSDGRDAEVAQNGRVERINERWALTKGSIVYNEIRCVEISTTAKLIAVQTG